MKKRYNNNSNHYITNKRTFHYCLSCYLLYSLIFIYSSINNSNNKSQHNFFNIYGQVIAVVTKLPLLSTVILQQFPLGDFVITPLFPELVMSEIYTSPFVTSTV